MTPGAEPWEAAAFGLRLTAALDDPPPLAPPAAAPAARACVVRERAPAEARAAWPRAASRRVAALRAHDGALALTVEEAPGAGYRFGLPGSGTWTVAHDGAAVTVAARPMRPWKARRLLFAHVLPLAAALRGVEVLHAAAAARDGTAIAIAAGRGGGKSTVLAELLVAGWAFVADDTVAAERRGDDVVVHPGPGTLALREDAARRLAAAGAGAVLGPVLGRDGRTHHAPAPAPRPLPLRRLFVLERDRRRGADVEVAAPAGSAFQLLTGNAKVPFVMPPSRLAAQLELSSAIARAVPLRAVRFGPQAAPAAVAAAIAGDLA